jgi:hypothetical protein
MDGHTRDGISLKLALFNLQKYIKEEDFVVDFMLKGGVKMLVRLMEGDSGLAGNSLAVSSSCLPYCVANGSSMRYKVFEGY